MNLKPNQNALKSKRMKKGDPKLYLCFLYDESESSLIFHIDYGRFHYLNIKKYRLALIQLDVDAKLQSFLCDHLWI